MSKKKVKKFVENMFDKRADIITKDNEIYHIRKIRMYNSETDYYGKVCAISSNTYNKNNLHIIKEFYETNQSDRIHVRLCRLTNVKMVKTIEKLPDGRERKILLINGYDDSSEYIHSIGPIKDFKTDKTIEVKSHVLNNNKILKLISFKDNKEENSKKVA